MTSLCFRVQRGPKRADTTRLTSQISTRRDLITTSAVERARKNQDPPRSVVCTKEQTWRPFCTSLRRQHSSAPRRENAAKVSRQKSASNIDTYRFLLLLHPRWHLRHCPVDRGIFVQVRQILAAEDGQRLTSIQRPCPKRQFTHF